jgi:hypothetical protein
VESLEREAGQCRSRGSPRGLWADLGVDISPEDIAETRREMWEAFPTGHQFFSDVIYVSCPSGTPWDGVK